MVARFGWDEARAEIAKLPEGPAREYAWGLLATAVQGAVVDLRMLRTSHANPDRAAVLRAQARRAREDQHTTTQRKAPA